MGPHANVLPSASRIRTIPGLPLASHALGSMGARFCSICKRPAQASLTHTLRVRSMCARHISPANRARGTSEGQQVLSCPRSSTASSSAVSPYWLSCARAGGRRGEPGRCYLRSVFSRSRSLPARAARGLVCVRGGVGSNGSAAPARPRGRRTFRGKRAAASDARRRPKPLLGETGLVVTGSLPRSQRRPNGRANRRTRHFSAERARRGQWRGVGAPASVGGVE